MPQPFDLSQFPDLPPEVVKAFAAVQFELSVERAAREHEQAVVAEKEAFITELKGKRRFQPIDLPVSDA
jgi:transposase